MPYAGAGGIIILGIGFRLLKALLFWIWKGPSHWYDGIIWDAMEIINKFLP